MKTFQTLKNLNISKQFSFCFKPDWFPQTLVFLNFLPGLTACKGDLDCPKKERKTKRKANRKPGIDKGCSEATQLIWTFHLKLSMCPKSSILEYVKQCTISTSFSPSCGRSLNNESR